MHRVEQRLSMRSYRGSTSNNPKLWEFGSNLITPEGGEVKKDLLLMRSHRD
jgi:hypothetical protein